jgi:RNA polymerase sigma factor (sigma-70 family)
MKKPEAERLIRLWQEEGDTKARDALLLAHMNFIRWWVGKHMPSKFSGREADDVQQLACMGFLEAIDRYDLTRPDRNLLSLSKYYILKTCNREPGGDEWWRKEKREPGKFALSIEAASVKGHPMQHKVDAPRDSHLQYEWGLLEPSTTESIIADLAHDVRRAARKILDARQLYVYVEHFEKERTFESIGKDLNISRQRAHILATEAREKLRKHFKRLRE